MRRLFLSDLKRLGSNVITIITVLGLVALPSIFSWYNIIACWNVFDNTGNLTVAVANNDEGYTSDLVPLKVNIGDRVTSALRANDQLNWVFTDEEDAIDGARSGRYYAAVVIPSSFSSDMMSFYSTDMEHAKITYYSNQKKSAIAPKVTDQGASQVSAQVNKAFAETISEVSLGISSALLSYSDKADANGQLGKLADHTATLSSQMRDASSALSVYSEVLSSAQALIDESQALIAQARASVGDVASSVENARQSSGGIVAALNEASAKLAETVRTASDDYAQAKAAIDAAFDESASSAAEAESALRDQAVKASAAGDDVRSALHTKLADDIHEASASTQAARSKAAGSADTAQQNLNTVKTDVDEVLEPTVNELTTAVEKASGTLSQTADTLDATSADLVGTANSLSGKLGESRAKLDSAIAELNASADKLEKLSVDISSALANNDSDALRNIIGSDPEAFAAALAAPVEIERHAVYPVENFGSAMSPLYTTLALWIGALLIIVTLRVIPSQRTLDEVGTLSSRQIFLGRFGIFSLISFAQCTCLSLGNLLFLGVQAENPLLYLLCFWISGQVITFIIYTFVSLFANLGKALSVVLLIVQVSGGGGSFPLKLLPPFFQNLSPYLPLTHVVNAMRAAMFGVYAGDFWIETLTLILFAIPPAILGLALHDPLNRIVPKFVERVEKSKLM